MKLSSLAVLIAVLSTVGCAITPMSPWAQYIWENPEGTVVSGPFRFDERGIPMNDIRSSCEYVYPPYAVKVVNESTGDEHFFICEELAQQNQQTASN